MLSGQKGVHFRSEANRVVCRYPPYLRRRILAKTLQTRLRRRRRRPLRRPARSPCSSDDGSETDDDDGGRRNGRDGGGDGRGPVFQTPWREEHHPHQFRRRLRLPDRFLVYEASILTLLLFSARQTLHMCLFPCSLSLFVSYAIGG